MSADTIKELQVALSMDTNGFSSAIKKAESDIKSMQSSFKQNAQTIKGYKDSFDGLTEKIKINDTIIAKHKATIEKNTQELKEHEGQTQKLKTAYDTAKNTYQENARALEKIKTELGENSAEYKTLKATVEANKAAMDKAGQAYTTNATKVQNLNTKIVNSQTQVAKLSSENIKLNAKLSQLGNSTQTTAQKMQSLKEKTALLDSQARLLTSSLGLNATASQKLRVEHTNLANKMDVTKQKVDVLKAKMLELRASKAQLVSQTTDLKRRILEEEQALEKAKAQYGENSSEVQKISGRIAQYKSELIATESVIQKTNQDINKNTIALNTNQAELNESSTAMTSLKAKMNALPFTQMGAKLDAIGTKLTTLGQGMKNTGRMMSMYITAPIVGLGIKAVSSSIEFEAAMSNVKAISNETSENMAILSEKARELGKSTSFSAKEVADAMSYQALAGWQASDMLTATEPILRLAEAGNLDLAKASDLVTDSMSSAGVSFDKLGIYLDQMAKTASTSNTAIDQLMEAFLVAGPVAKQLSIPTESLASALGVLANNGVKSSESGKALSTILSRMGKPTKDIQKSFDKLNIDIFDSKGKFKGLETVLGDLNKAFSGLTEEQKIQHATAIAGKNYLSQFLMLVDSGNGTMQSYTKTVKDSDNALMTMSKTMKDNAQGNLERLKSSFSELMIQIGDKILPHVNKFVIKLTELMDKFGELSEEQQESIMKFAGLAAAIGPLLMIIGTLTTGLGSIIKIGGKLSTGIGGLISKFTTLSAGASTASTTISGASTASTGLTATLGTMGSKVLTLIGPWGLLAGAVLGAGVAITNTAKKNLENTKSMQASAKETVHNISARYDELGNNVTKAMDDIKKSQEEWMTPKAKATLTRDFKDIQKIINGEGGNAEKEMNTLISHLNENAEKMNPEMRKATAESLKEMAETFARDGQLSVRQAEKIVDDINNTFNTKLKFDNTILDDLLFNGSLDRLGGNLRDSVGSKIQGWMGDVDKASRSIVSSIKTEFAGLDSIDTTKLFAQLNNDLKDLGASSEETKEILMGTLRPAILESMSGEEATQFAQQVVSACFSASDATQGYTQVLEQMGTGYETMSLEQQLAFGEMSINLAEQMGYMEEILNGSHDAMFSQNENLWADMLGSQLQGSENMNLALSDFSQGLGAQIANLDKQEEIEQALSWTNTFISRLVETGQITTEQAQLMAGAINQHLDGKEVTTKVSIDTTGFEAEINSSIADINALTGLTATPVTLLDDNKFRESETAVKEKIEKLKKEKAEPKVIAKHEQALKDLQSVKNSLDKLKDKTITITTKKKEEVVKSYTTSQTNPMYRSISEPLETASNIARAMSIQTADITSDYQISGGYYSRQTAPKVKSKEEGILETIKTLLANKSNSKGNGGFVQNLTINSAKELSPREIAKQTRLAGQKLARLY